MRNMEWTEVLEGWCEDEWDEFAEDVDREYRPTYPDKYLGSIIDNNVVKSLFGVPDLKGMDERWIQACRESFNSIPKLPKPKKVSELANEWNMKPKEVKEYLKTNEGWIKLNNWYWIPVTPHIVNLISLCNKKKVQVNQVILALVRLRDYLNENNILDPSREGLTKIIGINALNLLIRINALKALRLWTKKKVVYYVPSYFWNNLKYGRI